MDAGSTYASGRARVTGLVGDLAGSDLALFAPPDIDIDE
jgi:hypothetical protein